MRRYLMFLSYIGTKFRGIQSQPRVNKDGVSVNTVQDSIENALRSEFQFVNDFKVIPSSRTDAGVHALRTSVHVDLQHVREERVLNPSILTHLLNRHFDRQNIDIRIHSSHLVANTFHARHSAESRTYLYRLAVSKSCSYTWESHKKYLVPTPISEYQRTHFIKADKFDIELAQQVVALLPGTKDFCTFMGRPSSQPDLKRTILTLQSASLLPGRPLLDNFDPSADAFTYWNFVCTGKSFLYNQVRRMVAVVIAVARGLLSVEDVKHMLDVPGPESWNTKAVMVPPHALFLVNVDYNSEDLKEPTEQLPVDSQQDESP